MIESHQQVTSIVSDELFKAQFGEDRVLWEIFRHSPTGYFIEVGAYDGVNLSNTYFLEQMGWKGLLLEPIAQLARMAAVARPGSQVAWTAAGKRGSRGKAKFTVANNVPVLSFLKADDEHAQRCIREGATLIEIEVPITSLDSLLVDVRRKSPPEKSPWVKKHGWRIDLVSIDTEGCELDVLDGFDLDRFKPRILVIENDRPSGDEIQPYLTRRGYRKFHRQKINDFYARTDGSSDDLRLRDLDAVVA
ncbi:MAG: FkbM family methyltransferase [Planctomycetota bacterium]|jgi:hypothetical protein